MNGKFFSELAFCNYTANIYRSGRRFCESVQNLLTYKEILNWIKMNYEWSYEL